MNPEPNRERRPPAEAGARPDRMQELGRLTAELLHDLASALAVLDGRIALARDEAARGRVPAEELARIGTESEELRAMVMEILAEVRGDRPSPEEDVPVVATLEGIVERWLAGAPRVSASLEVHLEEGTSIPGPRSFFVRAIGNLLRNAARHARSRIHLSVRSLPGETGVAIRVEDDGDGVPETLRATLFEPFVTGSRQGTGLGLSFARWGIERLGGTLHHEGRSPGFGGASFRVELPLAPLRRTRPGATRGRTTSMAGEKGPGGWGRLDGLRVAVVDDDAAVRDTFVRLLVRDGAEPLSLDPSAFPTAESVADRLASERPDVILLDLTLGRLDGRRIAAAMQRRPGKLHDRILLCTGAPAGEGDPDAPRVSKLLPWVQIAERIRSLGSSG